MASGNPAANDESRSQYLGSHLVEGERGRGPTGTLLEGRDETLDRPVMLEWLHADLPPEQARRLRQNAQALAKIDHPNVVPVLEVGQAEGRTYVAMPRVRGRPLAEWVTTGTPDWRARIEAYLQAGRGLAAAHEVGLVHGDFQPAHAVRDDDGRVVVLGFGEARTVDSIPGAPTEEDGDDPLETTSSGLAAAGPYASPEQLEGRAADEASDQYSFCACLYEAVYGQQPRLGAGERLSPPSTTAPSALLPILSRGLARDPSARWSSMHAVLEPLESLVAPRSRRWPAVVVGIGAMALGVGLWVRGTEPPRNPCANARGRLADVWDDGRRQQLASTLTGAAVPYAVSTWERVESNLDRYADDWARKHTEVCEATAVEHTQGDEALDLRMHCLDERRSSLGAVVDVLAQADDSMMDKAVDLTADLPRLAICDDVERLAERRQRVPPPEDPTIALEVESLRQALRAVDAKRNAALFAVAKTEAEQVIAQAQTLGYAPLEAEARLRLGRLHENEGQFAEAEQELQRAHALALSLGHDEIVLEASRSLAFVVGERQARYAEGLQWLETALPLARRSGDPRQVAACLDRRGTVLSKERRFDEAAEALRQALAIEESDPEAETLLPQTLDSLGVVLSNQGQHEEAERIHRRVLEIRRRTQAVGHPSTGRTLHNLGHDLNRQGEFAKAESFYREAQQILEGALGADHPAVAVSQMSLGAALERQGQYDESEEQYRRALETFERKLGPDHLHVALTLNNLGNVLYQRGDYAGAEAQHRRALEAFEAEMGPDHVNAAMSANNLGVALFDQGRYEAAERHMRHALRVREAKLGPEHPDVATSANNLGNALTARGQLEEAATHYRRALEIRRAALGEEHPRFAESLTGLAFVHGNSGDHAEAERLHRQAVDVRRRALGDDHADVGSSLTNVGQSLIDQARHDEAEPVLREALAIKERALGEQSPRLVITLVALANASLAGNTPHAAREHAQRAVAIAQENSMTPRQLAEARFVLARAQWSDGGDRAAAVELARRAREAFAEHGADNQRDLVAVQRWLAERRAR
ncbi:MAG: tetratricopeptide repeat protein [Myxococcota bacterium]